MAVSPGSIRGVPSIDDRLDELVGDARVVALLHCFQDAMGLFSFARHEAVECELDPLDAAVAVHGVVPADDGGDAVLRQRREVVDRSSAARRRGRR